MGSRIVQVAIAISLFACSACSGQLGSLGSVETSAASSLAVPLNDEPTPRESAPPYVDAIAELRDLAHKFVSATLAYDAWAEEPHAFLKRVEKLATPGEIGRLRRSGRAQLSFWVLRQRSERVTVRIVGVSQQRHGDGAQAVQVEALRLTHSSVSSVRDFVEVRLVVVPTSAGWRVDRAVGGGL